MKASFKLAGLAGALSLVLGGSVLANDGSPQAHGGLLSFTGWTVNDGTIDYLAADVCDGTNYNCAVVAEGAGFAQVRVESTNAGGGFDDYIMTIVTDQNAGANGSVQAGAADLGFSDVSFIKMNIVLGGGVQNQGEGGIKSQQRIIENKNGTAFTSNTDINTGWSESAVGPLVIDQRVQSDGLAGTAGDNFNSGFFYKTTNDADAVRNGYYMNIDQFVGLQDFAAVGAENNPDDAQSFALRQRQGTFVDTAGSASVGGGTMSWDAYVAPAADGTGGNSDEVKAMWIGQQITAMSSDFGYTMLDNLTDASDPIVDFDLTSAAAADAWGTWADAGSQAELMFGTAPTITNPIGPE